MALHRAHGRRPHVTRPGILGESERAGVHDEMGSARLMRDHGREHRDPHVLRRAATDQHHSAVVEHVIPWPRFGDRKSTRLNSSHGYISYAVFCLKKKKKKKDELRDMHVCKETRQKEYINLLL